MAVASWQVPVFVVLIAVVGRVVRATTVMTSEAATVMSCASDVPHADQQNYSSADVIGAARRCRSCRRSLAGLEYQVDLLSLRIS